MKNDQRDVCFYDLEIYPSSGHALAPPISDVLAVLQGKVRAWDAYHWINSRKEVLTLRDIIIDSAAGVAIFLVTHADPAAPNAVYADMMKGTSAVIKKGPNEANEYGAHIVVSLIEEHHRPNTYLALIEKVPTLGRANIHRLLNAIINQVYKAKKDTFRCEDQTGQRLRGAPKMVSYRPLLKFSGHPSDDFIRDLEEGTLRGLTLYHAEEQVQLGRSPYLTKSEMSLSVNVNRKRFTDNLWYNLKETLLNESPHWERARIKFADRNGKTASVCVDSVNGNLLDDSYVKTITIGDLDPPIDNSSTRIVRHLVEKMLGELLARRQNGAPSQMGQKQKAYA
jgi:hypothetical protein